MSTEMTTTSEESFDAELAEGLERLDYYATGDYVEVEVAAVEQAGDSVTVTFEPPLGEPFERTYSVPHHPSADEPFNRLLTTVGHGYSNASNIIGDRVPATHADEWHLQLEHLPRSVRERLAETTTLKVYRRNFERLLLAGTIIYWPVVGLGLLVYDLADQESSTDIGKWVFAYAIGTGLWIFVAVFVYATVQIIMAGGMPVG